MLRRVKSDVEASLKPKLEYVVRVPLSPLQRQWYNRILAPASALATTTTAVITTLLLPRLPLLVQSSPL